MGDSVDVSKILEAIHVAYNPAEEEDTTAAQGYLEEIKTVPGIWRHVVEHLWSSDDVNVVHFALQVLEETAAILPRLDASERNDFHNLLLDWIRDPSEEHQHNALHTSFMVSMKFSVCYARAVIAEFPKYWPEAITSLLDAVKEVIDASPDGFSSERAGILRFQFLLRILQVIDEDVVNRDRHRSQTLQTAGVRIKDAIRDSCLGDLVDIWVWVLTHCEDHILDLVKSTLSTMALFVEWIDADYIFNEEFFSILFQFLDSEDLRNEAMECLLQMVQKNFFEAWAKVGILQDMQIFHIIRQTTSSLVLFQENPSEEELLEESMDPFVLKVAQLVDELGMELLDLVPRLGLQNGTQEQMAYLLQWVEELLPFAWRFFQHPDIAVSECVLNFSKLFARKLACGQLTLGNMGKSECPLPTEEQVQAAMNWVEIAQGRCIVPSDVDIHNPVSDEDSEFLTYREEIRETLKLIIRVLPNNTLEFIRGMLEAVFGGMSSNLEECAAQGESTMFIFNIFPEVFSKEYNNADLPREAVDILVTLIGSDMASHQHVGLSVAWFKCLEINTTFFQRSEEQYLWTALESFLDERGIFSDNPVIRTKSSEYLCHFGQSMRVQICSVAPLLLEKLQEMTSVDVSSIMATFEASGPKAAADLFFRMDEFFPIRLRLDLMHLLGSVISRHADVKALTERALASHFEILEQCHQEKWVSQDSADYPIISNLVAFLIRRMASFSKGFPGSPTLTQNSDLNSLRRVPEEKLFILDVWRAVEGILLDCLDFCIPVRLQSIFVLHRMLDMLGLAALEADGSPFQGVVVELLNRLPAIDSNKQMRVLEVEGMGIHAHVVEWSLESELVQVYSIASVAPRKYRHLALSVASAVVVPLLHSLTSVLASSGESSILDALYLVNQSNSDICKQVLNLVDKFVDCLITFCDNGCLDAFAFKDASGAVINLDDTVEFLYTAACIARVSRNITISCKATRFVSEMLVQWPAEPSLAEYGCSRLLDPIVQILGNPFCHPSSLDTKKLVSHVLSLIRGFLSLGGEEVACAVHESLCKLELHQYTSSSSRAPIAAIGTGPFGKGVVSFSLEPSVCSHLVECLLDEHNRLEDIQANVVTLFSSYRLPPVPQP